MKMVRAAKNSVNIKTYGLDIFFKSNNHVLIYLLTIALAKDVLEVLRSKPNRL